MNKILLFRFDSVSPNDIDQKVLKSATRHNGESMKVESTRYGFVAILNTNLDVGGLHIRYKRQERMSKVRMPLFIINLEGKGVKCSSSIFNFNKINEMIDVVRRESNFSFEPCNLTVDEILEKIHATGLENLSFSERKKLDDYSNKLNEESKNKKKINKKSKRTLNKKK